MNEKGLAVSVNTIQDSASLDQNTGKPSLTTTTAVRLLLNKAASATEALVKRTIITVKTTRTDLHWLE